MTDYNRHHGIYRAIVKEIIAREEAGDTSFSAAEIGKVIGENGRSTKGYLKSVSGFEYNKKKQRYELNGEEIKVSV